MFRTYKLNPNVSYNLGTIPFLQEAIFMPDNTKSFSEQWRENIYMAHVNFLRKRNLFEDWKKFKAGKKLKQDDLRLMSEFINLLEKSGQV